MCEIIEIIEKLRAFRIIYDSRIHYLYLFRYNQYYYIKLKMNEDT